MKKELIAESLVDACEELIDNIEAGRDLVESVTMLKFSISEHNKAQYAGQGHGMSAEQREKMDELRKALLSAKSRLSAFYMMTSDPRFTDRHNDSETTFQVLEVCRKALA